MDTFVLVVQFLIVLACLVVGARKGGMGLGLIGGIGLIILVFGFGLAPGEPPVQVMLTILAVIGCAAVLQVAGGLDVLMRAAERILRKHPKHITILGPVTTWFLTVLCGTGHVVYTMLPIISDIALKKNIRPERPMAISSVASQMGITASPVSVAVVSLVSILAAQHGIGPGYSIPQILMISVPASLCGVLIGALWSLKRGKDLDKDPVFQAKIADPKVREEIYADGHTLMGTTSPRSAYWAVAIFFTGIAIVVLLGAFENLRPAFVAAEGEAPKAISMNLTIQMVMLVAGALILLFCKVKSAEIATSGVFKAGMVAIFAVFGVAWMSDTFFSAHLDSLEASLAGVVQDAPWLYALVLFLVSKLVNSQAAAVTAIVPVGLSLGVDPVTIIGFFGASYGYFILPTYPSDLAAIGFDRTGTTHIGKFVINHSFLVPGLICVFTSCVVGYFLAHALL